LAAWNLVLPGTTGSGKTVTFEFAGGKGLHTALVHRLDGAHGSLLNAYEQLGRPQYPSSSQINRLRQAAALPPPEQMSINGNRLTVELPAQSLVVIELK
jgi:xylan 1,4-beta-xylosidase